MGFSSEEDLEIWYSQEKEKLDASFTSALDRNRDKSPQAKERYEAAFKKLILKYQRECDNLIKKKRYCK